MWKCRQSNHVAWIALPEKKGVQYFMTCAVKHFRQGEIEEEKFCEK